MICPIPRACEMLEPRWTIPIIVALWSGATKFNDIRREIGTVSPALPSKCLRELEEFGLIERIEDRATGSVDYVRTEMAEAVEPALNTLARWAQRYIEAEFALSEATAAQLMWKMRALFVRDALPARRVVIQFRFADDGLDYDTYRAVIVPVAPVGICTSAQKFEVDLYVETTVMSLLGIIQARTTIARELDLGTLFLSGDPFLARSMGRWLKRSDYANEPDILQLPNSRCPLTGSPRQRAAV